MLLILKICYFANGQASKKTKTRSALEISGQFSWDNWVIVNFLISVGITQLLYNIKIFRFPAKCKHNWKSIHKETHFCKFLSLSKSISAGCKNGWIMHDLSRGFDNRNLLMWEKKIDEALSHLEEMECAVETGYESYVNILIEKGADVNTGIAECFTQLMGAAKLDT